MLRYCITASIDPKEQVLSAEVRLSYQSQGEKDLKFCLHRDLVLEEVKGANVRGFSIGEPEFQFAPEAITINLELVAPGTKGQEEEICFKYRGQLGITTSWEVNRLTPKWTELGIYTPWFPLILPMQVAEFSIQLTLPPEYTLISSGDTKPGWFVEQSVPSTDCTLIAAPGFLVSQAEKEGAVVAASYTEPRAEAAALVFSEIGAEVLAWYTKTFGSLKANHVDIVIAPRTKGGGYARPGFIVFGANSNLEDIPKLYRYIGHEFGHLWWYRANTTTWEDWLNESLAEFSALMAIRDLLGLETYSQLLEVRKDQAMNLPPIYGIARNSEDAYTVLYFKGCVLLAELEADLGKDNFLDFLQELVRREVRTTGEFLEVLARKSGDKTAADFDAKLKNR